MQKTYDLNTFRVGQAVTVPGVEDYENIVIQRISDAGVTVNGKCGNNIVISGRTPAIPYAKEEKVVEAQAANLNQNKIMTTENNTNSEVVDETVSNRAKRGSIKAKMAAIKVPANPFTVKQLAELNDIPAGYANNWVKENARQVGQVEKTVGQRGRVASLFEV